MSDKIPIVETYRGIGLHDQQPRQRIDSVVKPELDRVLLLSDAVALARIASDVSWSPESRILAGGMAQASYNLAADERRERPEINLDVLRAHTAGLDSVLWRDPFSYCSLLDSERHAPGAVHRPVRREEPIA